MMSAPPSIPRPVLAIEPFAPTAAHLAQIQDAKRIGKKIRNAATVATMGGWFTAVFAAITFMLSVGDVFGMALGAAMGVISYFEFRGSNELKRLDPTAPKRLALNQLAFALLIMIYGFVSLYSARFGAIAGASEISQYPEIADVYGDIESLTRNILTIVYGGVILFGLLGPGLTALYYYTRKSHIERYLQSTPKWILDLQRAGMTL
jgi:hypothetical protein